MKKSILFLIFIIPSLFLKAQAPTFQWAKQMGGASNDYGRSIVVDVSGNVISSGLFYGTADFDPGIGTYSLTATSSNNQDIFISKLDASGNFTWAKNVGGVGTSYISSEEIALDGLNNIYVTGYFQGTVDFDPSAGTYTLSTSGPTNNGFILKLDASGNFI